MSTHGLNKEGKIIENIDLNVWNNVIEKINKFKESYNKQNVDEFEMIW